MGGLLKSGDCVFFFGWRIHVCTRRPAVSPTLPSLPSLPRLQFVHFWPYISEFQSYCHFHPSHTLFSWQLKTSISPEFANPPIPPIPPTPTFCTLLTVYQWNSVKLPLSSLPCYIFMTVEIQPFPTIILVSEKVCLYNYIEGLQDLAYSEPSHNPPITKKVYNIATVRSL